MSNLYRYTTYVRINLILLELSVIDLFSVLGLILAFFFFLILAIFILWPFLSSLVKSGCLSQMSVCILWDRQEGKPTLVRDRRATSGFLRLTLSLSLAQNGPLGFKPLMNFSTYLFLAWVY